MIKQVELTLNRKERGFHLITEEVIAQLSNVPATGIFHLYCTHTSAGLTINENCDSSVRVDFESMFNHLVPENLSLYTHTYEGPDDMPAHIKAALIGSSITVPIKDHQLALGTWQGIYFCEFRNEARARKLIATIYE